MAPLKEKSCLQQASYNSVWRLDKHWQRYNCKANLLAVSVSLFVPRVCHQLCLCFLRDSDAGAEGPHQRHCPTSLDVAGFAIWSTNNLRKAEVIDHAQAPARSSRKWARDGAITQIQGPPRRRTTSSTVPPGRARD